MTIEVISPKPPLTLNISVSIPVDNVWTTLFDVYRWRVPKQGALPSYTEEISITLTSLVVTNESGSDITFNLRRSFDTGVDQVDRMVLLSEPVSATSARLIDTMTKFIVQTGWRLEMQTVEPGASCLAHLSFVLSTAQRYEVIT